MLITFEEKINHTPAIPNKQVATLYVGQPTDFHSEQHLAVPVKGTTRLRTDCLNNE